MTISLSITVGILCATVITVLFESSCLIILCRTSVAESMEAVASSRTRILFLLRRTLMKDSITEDYTLWWSQWKQVYMNNFKKRKSRKMRERARKLGNERERNERKLLFNSREFFHTLHLCPLSGLYTTRLS